jgi:hypothetical protein
VDQRAIVQAKERLARLRAGRRLQEARARKRTARGVKAEATAAAAAELRYQTDALQRQMFEAPW